MKLRWRDSYTKMGGYARKEEERVAEASESGQGTFRCQSPRPGVSRQSGRRRGSGRPDESGRGGCGGRTRAGRGRAGGTVGTRASPRAACAMSTNEVVVDERAKRCSEDE